MFCGFLFYIKDVFLEIENDIVIYYCCEGYIVN